VLGLRCGAALSVPLIGATESQLSTLSERFGGVEEIDFSADQPAVEVVATGAEASLCRELSMSLRPYERVICRSDGTDVVTFHYDGWACPQRLSGGVRVHTCSGGAACGGGILEAAICYMLANQGALHLHGACFSRGPTCVIALADSGGGKSSLTAAALGAGCKVISDDAVIIAEGNPSKRYLAYAGREDVWLCPDGASLLPKAISQLLDPRIGRVGKLGLPRSAASPYFQARCTATHLLLLESRDRSTKNVVRPASQGEALAALVAASANLSMSGLSPDAAATRTAMGLATAIPALHVSVSERLLSEPGGTVRDLLAKVEAVATSGNAREADCKSRNPTACELPSVRAKV
jgi:hypothetical protein